MLINLHTHTTFSDGKNTPEEMIIYAIENGFSAIGFSDHGYTPYDERYCMKDTAGYVAEVNRLKEKYKGKIDVYLGVEEDSRNYQNRADFDYIIGSCHYMEKDGKKYPLDSNYDYFSKCIEVFDGDALALAKSYYEHFCAYINERKPDVIGHFDLMTKFDETKVNRFLDNPKYWEKAEEYVKIALKSGSLFEVNTGLMARGFRSLPCPHERLLKIILEEGGKVTITSDAHCAEKLCSHFEEVKKLLLKIGFKHYYTLVKGKWEKQELNKS